MFAVFTLTGLLIGVTMTALGVVAVKWTYGLVNLTGRQGWIEKYTGQGSTYGVFKLVSVLLIMGGVLVATGFGDNLINFLLAPLYHVFAPLSGVK